MTFITKRIALLASLILTRDWIIVTTDQQCTWSDVVKPLIVSPPRITMPLSASGC